MAEELRRCVAEKRGVVDVTDAALVQSAMRHEQSAQLALRWLRMGKGKDEDGNLVELPLAERLQILAVVRSATDARDRCIDKLDIRIDPADAFKALRVEGAAA